MWLRGGLRRGGQFCGRDAYRCDRDVSQQMKLGARGIVDRQLGLQQAQLQKPNGWDDSTEVQENHGGEPEKGPPKERKDGRGGGRGVSSKIGTFSQFEKHDSNLVFVPYKPLRSVNECSI